MSDNNVYYVRNSDQKRFRPICGSAAETTLETQDGTSITVTTEKLYAEFTMQGSTRKIEEGSKKPYTQIPKPPTAKPPTAEHIMQEAIKTMAERGKTYDTTDNTVPRSEDYPAPVERSMGKVVSMFNTLTGHTLTEEQGWDFMVLLKLSRASNGYKADNFVGGAAYFGLAGECAAEKDYEKN